MVLGAQQVQLALVLLNPRGQTALFGRRLRQLRAQLGQRHVFAGFKVGQGPVMLGAHEIPFALLLLGTRGHAALLGQGLHQL